MHSVISASHDTDYNALELQKQNIKLSVKLHVSLFGLLLYLAEYSEHIMDKTYISHLLFCIRRLCFPPGFRFTTYYI